MVADEVIATIRSKSIPIGLWITMVLWIVDASREISRIFSARTMAVIAGTIHGGLDTISPWGHPCGSIAWLEACCLCLGCFCLVRRWQWDVSLFFLWDIL
jgi:hypothetical protein